MKFGLYTICQYENDAPEPEGVVIYDKLPPDIGTEVVLSCGKVWVVSSVDREYSKVYVKRKR